MNNSADIVEVYDSHDDAIRTSAEWRTSERTERVRIVKRTVRAFGATAEVWAVCVWWTAQARAMGWCA